MFGTPLVNFIHRDGGAKSWTLQSQEAASGSLAEVGTVTAYESQCLKTLGECAVSCHITCLTSHCVRMCADEVLLHAEHAGLTGNCQPGQ